MDDQVQSPARESSTPHEGSGARNDLDSIEPSPAAAASLLEPDSIEPVEGDLRAMQKERAERAATSLRFFAEPEEFRRPDIPRPHEAATSSRGRGERVRLDRGKAKLVEEHSSPAALLAGTDSHPTPSASPRRTSAPESPKASDEAANSHMAFMMKVLEMQREMQRENREFQREVRAESRNLMAAVPELIAQTVSRMSFPLNPNPLNAIEGAHVSVKQLLIGNSSYSPKSSDSVQPLPDVEVHSPSLQRSVEVIVTPAPTLPGPTDRLVDITAVEDASPSIPESHNRVDAVCLSTFFSEMLYYSTMMTPMVHLNSYLFLWCRTTLETSQLALLRKALVIALKASNLSKMCQRHLTFPLTIWPSHLLKLRRRPCLRLPLIRYVNCWFHYVYLVIWLTSCK